jgi:hypothetical protein
MPGLPEGSPLEELYVDSQFRSHRIYGLASVLPPRHRRWRLEATKALAELGSIGLIESGFDDASEPELRSSALTGNPSRDGQRTGQPIPPRHPTHHDNLGPLEALDLDPRSRPPAWQVAAVEALGHDAFEVVFLGRSQHGQPLAKAGRRGAPRRTVQVDVL